LGFLSPKFHSSIVTNPSLEFVESEQTEDFDGRDLKVALLAEWWVVEGRAALRLAEGQARVDVNAVSVTKK
jgi:hypothetical protein